MYEAALSISAFVRSGTPAYLVWQINPGNADEFLVLTAGGGRLGQVSNGIFDSALSELANLKFSNGRLVNLEIGAFEASISNYEQGVNLQYLLIPVSQFPEHIWSALLERQSLAINCLIENNEITQINVYMNSNIENAPAQVADLYVTNQQGIFQSENSITTIISAKTKLVIAGTGPNADALEAVGKAIGWNVRKESRNDIVAGYVADMSEKDGIVVFGHNVEQSARSLELALDSNAGYIGAVGSLKMQDARADWLAYRDKTDLSRVNGPAGLDLNANTPGEIAISVIAQMINIINREN